METMTTYSVYEKRSNGTLFKIKSGLSYSKAMEMWRKNMVKRTIEIDD